LITFSPSGRMLQDVAPPLQKMQYVFRCETQSRYGTCRLGDHSRMWVFFPDRGFVERRLLDPVLLLVPGAFDLGPLY